MRLVIDACVLVPALTRALVMDAASVGAFTPLWSAQILDEWRHAVTKLGPVEAAQVSTEIALLGANYPSAAVAVREETLGTLTLPDPDDRHVLAAALAGEAEAILTFNTKDFPIRTLGAYGLLRRHPDEFLLEVAQANLGLFDASVSRAADAADRSPKALLRASHLPRLAKFLTA